MTPGYVVTVCWVGIFLALNSPVTLRAADPVIAHGVTNIAIGQAQLNRDAYYYNYYVTNLRSNGLDGVSVHLGEPDSGVSFSPYTGDVQDGYYMFARMYGHLHGTNNAFLGVIQGGRASRQVYPLSLDYSPLAPQSITYQVFYNGFLQREFTRGTPMVVVSYDWGPYPTVNPLFQRRSDGALGTSLKLSAPVTFVFPEFLVSAGGDELFIRLNNPANSPGPLSRLDIHGGGGLYEYTFTDLALGVFGRSHRSLYGATLQARPNWLRIGNFVSSNDVPGMVVTLEQVGALNMQFEPFQVAESNAFLRVTSTGQAAREPYDSLGTLRIERKPDEDQVFISFEQERLDEIQVLVLTNGSIAYAVNIPASYSVTVETNAQIGGITAQARTLENLAGYHVRFAEQIPMTVDFTPVMGDEVRLVLPAPARMEYLHTLHLSGRGIDSLTLTNEIAAPTSPPARLQIAKAGTNVVVQWPDPNRVLTLAEAYYGGPDGPYFFVTNPVSFTDPYASLTLPIVRTNKFTFFRLFYEPYE